MKHRWIATLTAIIMIAQLISLPAAALYDQAAEQRLLAPRADYGAGRRTVSAAEEEAEEIEGPADVWESVSETQEVEQVDTESGITPLAWTPYQYVKYSFGIAVDTMSGKLVDTSGALRAEVPQAELSSISAWLPGWYAGTASMTWVAGVSATLDFAEMGNPDDVRIPDKEFDGWYVYNDALIVTNSNNWRYRDGLERVEPDIPGGTTSVIDTDFSGFTSAQGNRMLPLVARWKDSGRAELRKDQTVLQPVRGAAAGTAITEFYGTDFGSGVLPDTTIAFDPAVYTYYLRVDADVTAMKLNLATVEPYYDYFKNHYAAGSGLSQSPVTAEVTYGGATTQLTEGFLGGNAAIKPAAISAAGQLFPQNSEANPARAEWALTVPLQMCAGAEKLYNTLVIGITAPDGTQAAYTFHIQRLAEPKMKLNPGNTPFGMIERDTSSFWVNNQALKDAAKEYFKTYRTFHFAASQYPMDSVNNNGGSLTRKTYSAAAWGVGTGVVDYDLDPYAIVVYQDSAFLDPGIAGLTNAAGFTQAVSGVVSRTIALRTADQLNLSLIKKDGGEWKYYDGTANQLVAGPHADTLQTTNGGGNADVVDLRGLNILPGIYSMEYSYIDTAAGKVYDSDADHFSLNKGNADTFRRTLIVLPIPGDVDMDGMVTPVDASALRTLGGLSGSTITTTRLNGISVGLSGAARDSVVDVMYHRVCDVTGDGLVSIGELIMPGDVLALQGGYLPQLTDYYYLPLPSGSAAYQRATLLSKEAAEADAGKLTLEFLGTQKGEMSGGLYPTPVQEPNYSGTVTDVVKLGETFWVGVKLSGVADSGLAGSLVNSFTMSLTYDSRYVKPAAVLDTNDTAAIISGMKAWDISTLKYNVGGLSRTIWGSDSRYEAPLLGLMQERAYQTHYTKAITPLEQSTRSTLREMVFSIQLRSGSYTPVALRDGWLLVVPFELATFPDDEENPVLIEMGAGMREFIFSGSGGIAAGPLSADGEISALSSETGTAAYSGQDSIYGGRTLNLKDEIKYTEGVGIAIPVGEDTTPAILLYNREYSGQNVNAKYGDSFRSMGLTGMLGAGDSLPPGLTYGSGTGQQIIGTPTQAGDYTFRIGGVRYRIIVEKAEIRFAAASVNSYYGQTEYRGGQFTASFLYYTSDIKAIDAGRVGVTNSGDGAVLFNLLGEDAGYQAPRFRAVLNGSPTVAVGQKTEVGTYAITCPEEYLPQSTNYTFRYVSENPMGSSVAVNRLTILARPISVLGLLLDKDQDEFVGEIYEDQNEYVSAKAVYTTGKKQFAAVLSTSGVNLPLTGDPILEGDELAITYTAELIRTQQDMEAGPIGYRFYLDGNVSETRNTRITNVVLAADPQGSPQNYQLVQGAQLSPTGNPADYMVYGRVWAQLVESIEIIRKPASLSYQYGDIFGRGSIAFRLRYTSGTTKDQIVLSENDWAYYRVTPAWLTEAEMQAAIANPSYPVGPEGVDGETGQIAPNTIGNPEHELDFDEMLTVAKHDGMYLCLSVATWDQSYEMTYIRTFMDALTVNAKVMTLTAKPVTRYYGEPNPESFTFTYSPSELAYFDRKEGETSGIARDGRELARLEGFQAPAMRAQKGLSGADAGVEVDETTDASVNSYYITISGAEAANYRFVYTVGTTGTTSASGGHSALTINRRPIVVEGIQSSISSATEIGTVGGVITTSQQENPTGVNLATIYSDSLSLVVSAVTSNANTKYNNNTLKYDLASGIQEFTVGLPRFDTTGTWYYNAGGSGSDPLFFSTTFAPGTTNAVVNGDVLSLTYTATFVPDKAFHRGLTDHYFDMSGADADSGDRYADIQVSNIALTGADAANYLLVYRDNADAVGGYPANRVPKLAPRLSFSNSPSVHYYVSGHGVLKTRTIQEISITNLPKMAYTYGNVYSPDSPKDGGRYPLTVRVGYSTDYDNTTGNTTSETVPFELGMQNGVLQSTFEARNMQILYLPEGKTNAADALPLVPNTYMTVSEHNNRPILVAGRRTESDQIIYSDLSNQVTSYHGSEVLSVAKKDLPVTVQSQHRYYGERNGNYTFTFLRSDLAVPDRDWISTAAGTGYAAVSNDAAAAGLRAAEGDLKGKGGYGAEGNALPSFTTAAQTSSAVRDGGRQGYTLSLSAGTMDNYNLVPVGDGAIYVYRRPIKVSAIASSDTNPIYSVYSDTASRIFETNVTRSGATIDLPVAAGQSYRNSNDTVFNQAVGAARPLNGSSVLAADELTFDIRVEFPNYGSDVLNAASATLMDVKVTSVSLNNSGAGQNYYLVSSTPNMPGRGLVELRKIGGIRLVSPPTKTEYTYPETLNLDGLRVEITYRTVGMEEDMIETVQYVGAAQFSGYGLYLRYVSGTVLPSGSDALKALINSGRKAESGDHLTRAYTQDTQGTDAPFKHDGSYIAVIAQRHADQPIEEAMFINPSSPLVVHPLEIQFSLAASDKTYDGNTEAVGTLTMENIFRQTTRVDQYHTSGITDVVFVKTGADNQTATGDADDHRSYADFKAAVAAAGGKYIFTSGSYVRDNENRLNDRLSFTGGVYGGEYTAGKRLTFEFLNPNVAYQADPSATHEPYGPLATAAVKAYNIELGGPDRDNYTLVSSVEEDSAATAAGYTGSALPRATIQKAARPDLTSILQAGGYHELAALLPTVQVDEHANAVQLRYDLSVAPFRNSFDAFNSEDHFEFALQYDNTAEGGSPRVGQWAGWSGRNAYQDTRFFGGEFVAVDVPSGYLADPRSIPTEYNPERDILRGQLYGWAEEDAEVDIYAPAYLRAILDDGSMSLIPYPTYQVYQAPADREALPRDTVFWGLVRLAETHNYLASPALSGVDGMDHTMITAESKASDALNENPGDAGAQAAVDAAASVLLSTAAGAIASAQADAAERSAALLEIAEEGKWPEGDLQPPMAAPAVKSFRQRFDLVSTSSLRSYGSSGSEEYVVPRLEAVWFTDILVYPEKRILDAVLRNMSQMRYYDYAWDADFSAPLELNDQNNPLSLETAFEVEVTERVNGQSADRLITVNQEPVNGIPTVNTAQVFVSIEPPNSDALRGLRIVPDTVTVRLGDYPLQLTVEFNPADIKRRTVTWQTSDPAVVVVNEYGVLEFVGVGSAVITVTAYTGKTATAAVTVLDPSINSVEAWDRMMLEQFPASIFNFAMTDAFSATDGAMMFYPEREMTRGDLAMFLVQFYRENAKWPGRGRGDFPDLTGEEPYADAARLLGELGVMTGIDGGLFAGDRLVTRAELTTVLARMIYADVPDTTGQLHAFIDSGEENTWAYSFIDAMSRLGVVQGTGDGTFRPERVVIRAEAAVVVDRLLRIVIDPNGARVVVPYDVRVDHWAYMPILRAVNGTDPEETES